MTSVFSADGKNVPCTVIEAGPCVVTQIKTVETDGYEAVQVGFQTKTEKHTNKAEAGVLVASINIRAVWATLAKTVPLPIT